MIHNPVPVLSAQGDFERVPAKLARINPKTTPPRVVNSPSLLTGVAVCACWIRNDPNWDNQSAGSLVLVLFLCGLPAEGQNGLQGMPYPGRDPGRNRRDQPQAACTGASATS